MADTPPLAPHEVYAYEPPVSLWAVVQTYVPPHEQEEVKNILGESLVEQSLELHAEVGTLLEIWRDYRSETNNRPMYHRLPEPPAARDRLRQEIKFFVDSIREKAKESGRDFGDIVVKYNKDVLEYVLKNKRPDSGSSRPSTARSSQDGRETPMTSRTPDRLLHGHKVCDEVETMQENLNFLKLDEIVLHLRETLEQEVEWLLRDIDFLQECLSDEADFRVQPTISREPTLTELREERSKLEKELLTSETSIPVALRSDTVTPVVKANSLSAKLPSAQLQPRPPSMPGLNQPSRSAPLKANHHISTQVLTLQHGDPSATQYGLSGDHGDKLSPERKTNKSNLDGEQTHNISKNLPHSRESSQKVSKSSPVREGPSHLTIRTSTIGNNTKLIELKTVPVNTADKILHSPSPPMSEKPSSGRPGSAQRFRRMVMNSRDGT